MRDRRGFTILELVVALMIVSIMVVISTSNLFSWLSHSAAVDFQRELLARSNDARARAMATNRQHRLVIDLGNGTATLQGGDKGTGTGPTGWTDIGNPIVGTRGAGILEIIATPAPGTVSPPAIFSFIYNPGGQVLSQDNSATIRVLDQARIRLAAENPSDGSTIRLFGWTSKARLEE